MTWGTYRKLDQELWEDRGVPEHLRQAVRVLNEVLRLDPLKFTALVDRYEAFDGEAGQALLDHPTVVATEKHDRVFLGVLGLLNGAFANDVFRIGGLMDKMGGTFQEFMIVMKNTN